MSSPNDHLIIAPIAESGKIQQPILIDKTSWLWKLFVKLAWILVWAIYLVIIGYNIWIYVQAY